VHEDVPRQILIKEWIHPWLRWLVSKTVATIEYLSAPRFSSIVVANPLTLNRFKFNGVIGININNFPVLAEFNSKTDGQTRHREVCYAGVITPERGIAALIEAMEGLDANLNLAGTYSSASFRETLIKKPGWANVIEHGFLENRKNIVEIMNRSQAGLVIFNPHHHHLVSLPNKLFEYMAAGLPVIASDFSYWKSLIGKYNCALFVDPENPKKVAQAINHLLNNPEKAKGMGLNGRRAVEEKFNWSVEEKKLIKLYESLS